MTLHTRPPTIEITDEELDRELAATPTPRRPNADSLADLHRKEAARCQERIAGAKKQLRADEAACKHARKVEKARHEEELTAIADAEQNARDRAAGSISEDEHLARYHRAALEALEG